ncbi:NAD-P-binding protein [Polyporus arcularius HHB13444]|uniref:NAD-P-binding protein n=1 Tax=Polyporus arcularius HHB13444 TaxID=1314778 RepID=A0A5C3PVU3_9APHY|nr:NAD-P-binding protein [Polyporus arcularius HHB13444]
MFIKYNQPVFQRSTIPDLTGKVAIVTGGNSGLGLATVQHLTRHGAKMYLASRSEASAAAAMEQLRSEGLGPRNGQIEWLELDLSDPRKAKRSAEDFLAREDRLDMLVNNAGIRSPDWGTHLPAHLTHVSSYISPVIFTRTLLPIMIKTARNPQNDVRIVTMSTSYISMFKGKTVRFNTVGDLNEEFKDAMLADMLRYAKTKLANVLYVKRLQKEFDALDIPITVMSVDPGTVDTPGFRSDPSLKIPIIGLIIRLWAWLTFDTPSEGAYGTVFAIASPAVRADRDKYKGAYIVPPGLVGTPQTPQAESAELAEELWQTTESLCASLTA